MPGIVEGAEAVEYGALVFIGFVDGSEQDGFWHPSIISGIIPKASFRLRGFLMERLFVMLLVFEDADDVGDYYRDDSQNDEQAHRGEKRYPREVGA